MRSKTFDERDHHHHLYKKSVLHLISSSLSSSVQDITGDLLSPTFPHKQFFKSSCYLSCFPFQQKVMTIKMLIFLEDHFLLLKKIKMWTDSIPVSVISLPLSHFLLLLLQAHFYSNKLFHFLTHNLFPLLSFLRSQIQDECCYNFRRIIESFLGYPATVKSFQF